MAASLSVTVIDAAPGNIITILGSGLSAGSGASVTLGSQGVNAPPGLTPQTITLPATFNGTSVAITIPDGVMNGTLTVTASDGTWATCSLRAVSQYVQASEYIGEGEDTSTLAPGELDVLLRRASSAVDAFMGESIRLLQRLERPKYKPRQNGAPKIYPWRTRGRRCPIVSIDQLVFVSAKDLVTVFNSNDLYVNDQLNYIEILAYAIGNYALLGELEVIGYSANVLELSYTSGYPVATYPAEVRNATIMTATALLNRRRRQAMGLGPFQSFENKVKVDSAGMEVPIEAKRMLVPYVVNSLS